MQSPDEYDRYISVEIPNEDTHPEFSAFVIKHIIHGPCGEKHRASPCMKKATV